MQPFHKRRQRRLIPLMALGAVTTLHAQAREADRRHHPPEIVRTQLSERVVSFHFEGPQRSNVIVVRASDGVVLIDTESSPSLGALLRDLILQEYPGEAIRYVINTHGHGDHTWGNQAFDAAQIIGHERVLEDMAAVAGDAQRDAQRIGAYLERLETRRAEMAAGDPEARELENTISYFATVKEGLESGFRSTPPTVTFTDSFSLDLEEITLILYSFPNAHSNSDILVLCPEERLLAAGDLFVAKMRPPYLRTTTVASLPVWIGRLDGVLDALAQTSVVIPGHGEFLSVGDVADVRDYLISQSSRIVGRSPALPVFEAAVEERGVSSALSLLDTLAADSTLYLLESDLVSLGYRYLYRQEAPDVAVRIFTAMTDLFPDSWNAWDCLGEASAEAGDIELAISSYRKSLDLNADNEHAARELSDLRR